MTWQYSSVEWWTEPEVELLVRLMEAGASFDDLTRRFGCSAAELELQAFYLGLRLPPRETPQFTSTSASGCAVPNVRVYFEPSLSTSQAAA